MARGQTSLTQDSVTTLSGSEGGSAYTGVRLTRGIIKNISGNGATIYVQWTSESDALSDTNGMPVNDGEVLGFDVSREGHKSSQLCAPVQALCTTSGGKVAYAFE